jgi:hypothetical protein
MFENVPFLSYSMQSKFAHISNMQNTKFSNKNNMDFKKCIV